MQTESDLLTSLSGVDAIVLVTAHKEFQDLDLSMIVSKMKNNILVDSRGIINSKKAKKAGLIFRGLGCKKS